MEQRFQNVDKNLWYIGRHPASIAAKYFYISKVVCAALQSFPSFHRFFRTYSAVLGAIRGTISKPRTEKLSVTNDYITYTHYIFFMRDNARIPTENKKKWVGHTTKTAMVMTMATHRSVQQASTLVHLSRMHTRISFGIRVYTTPGFNTIRHARLARRMQKRRKTRDRDDYYYFAF